jgi:hypothetical protein
MTPTICAQDCAQSTLIIEQYPEFNAKQFGIDFAPTNRVFRQGGFS